MTIDRNASFSATANWAAIAKDCLGCTDCRGACRAYLELIALPQAILHKAGPGGAT